MNKLDYKLTNKELYAPKQEPSIIDVPSMNFIMINGYGDPNDVDGEYPKAVELLYALSYSIKMSRKKILKSEDILDYVVPPLEGLWWLEDNTDMDFTQKSKFHWTSMIRVPDFISIEEFIQAQKEVQKKNPYLVPEKARFEAYSEGLCIQCMHIGPYDTESATIEKLEAFRVNQGLFNDFETLMPHGDTRKHHEIYLSDPRKANPLTMKTILRHPVKRNI